MEVSVNVDVDVDVVVPRMYFDDDEVTKNTIHVSTKIFNFCIT